MATVNNRAFSFCLWTNTSSRKAQFNINQVEWSTDPIGYTEGEPKCKHSSESDGTKEKKKEKRMDACMDSKVNANASPVLNKQPEEKLKTNKQSFSWHLKKH